MGGLHVSNTIKFDFNENCTHTTKQRFKPQQKDDEIQKIALYIDTSMRLEHSACLASFMVINYLHHHIPAH